MRISVRASNNVYNVQRIDTQSKSVNDVVREDVKESGREKVRLKDAASFKTQLNHEFLFV